MAGWTPRSMKIQDDPDGPSHQIDYYQTYSDHRLPAHGDSITGRGSEGQREKPPDPSGLGGKAPTPLAAHLNLSASDIALFFI